MTKHDRMHDPPRQQREQSGDDQRAEEDRGHRLPVGADIVPAGVMDPDQVHTPGIYVARVIKSGKLEKPIEQRTVRKRVA